MPVRNDSNGSVVFSGRSPAKNSSQKKHKTPNRDPTKNSIDGGVMLPPSPTSPSAAWISTNLVEEPEKVAGYMSETESGCNSGMGSASSVSGGSKTRNSSRSSVHLGVDRETSKERSRRRKTSVRRDAHATERQPHEQLHRMEIVIKPSQKQPPKSQEPPKKGTEKKKERPHKHKNVNNLLNRQHSAGADAGSESKYDSGKEGEIKPVRSPSKNRHGNGYRSDHKRRESTEYEVGSSALVKGSDTDLGPTWNPPARPAVGAERLR